MVIALDSNNDVLSSSKIIHVATKGNLKNAGNAKKVIVKAKVDKNGNKLMNYKSTSAITLRAGKTPGKLVHSTKIKASFTRSGTVKKHVGIRFESSNTQIATVSSKGTITAKKKGSCKINVFTQNGLCKIIKVRVK